MKNINDKGLLPIADHISSWGSNDERKIIFKCPKCATSFRYYEENEKYCHKCGQKIDWEGIRINLITDSNMIYEFFNNYEKRKEILDKIDRLNLKESKETV